MTVRSVVLGLNGLVVKSHGGANPRGVANAIGVTARMVLNDICERSASSPICIVATTSSAVISFTITSPIRLNPYVRVVSQ